MKIDIKNLFVSKTFVKMLLSYLVVVFITIVMVSSVVYLKFSNATMADIQTNMEDKLRQNMNQLDFMRNQVNALGLQLIDDHDIVAMIYRKNMNPVISYLAQMKLKQAVDSNSMISSIYAYNGYTGKYVSNLNASGAGTPLDQAMEKEIKEYSETERMKFLPLTYLNHALIGNEREEKIISIIFNDNPDLTIVNSGRSIRAANSMLIVNFKADYLQRFFTSLSDIQSSKTLLLDRNGRVVCDSGLLNFGKNLSRAENLKGILTAAKPSGYFSIKDRNGKYLMTYVASDSSPYVFVNRTDYSVLLHRIHGLRTKILLVCLGIMLLCVVLSIAAAYQMYLPLYKTMNSLRRQVAPSSWKKPELRSYNDIEDLKEMFSSILDKTNRLENSMSYDAPFIKRVFLKLLLKGDAAALSNLSRKANEINLRIRDGRSCVILFSIDGYQELAKLKDKLAESLLAAQIENEINQIFSDFVNVETIDMDQGQVAVIANLRNDLPVFDTMREWIVLIQKAIKSNVGITVSAACGSIVDNLDSLTLSYQDCLELMKYRFMEGYQCVLNAQYFEQIKDKSFTEGEKYRKQIVKCVKDSDSSGLEDKMEDLFSKFKDNRYESVRRAVNQLVFDILKDVADIAATDRNPELCSMFAVIEEQDTLDSLRRWTVKVCSEYMECMESRRTSRCKDVIGIAVSYLELNFCSSELSTEAVADAVNLSPGYLGKLFSEHMGKTVNEYINELRMKKAREELENSSAPVCDIAARVGFSNQSYFTAIFKKHFGVTPNQHRLNSSKLCSDRSYSKIM